MKENFLVDLSKQFAVDIVNLCTDWLYNPRFWHKNIPFALMTHMESVVCHTMER